MSKELVIGSNRHETKVAILEEDQLVEVYFQRGNEYSLAGSIHKGRVTRVLPGMQSAFVDLGLERDTFLYVSDFFEENEDIDTVGDEIPVRREPREMRDGSDRQARDGSDRRQARDNPEGRDFRSRGERPAVERSADETLLNSTNVRTISVNPVVFEALSLEVVSPVSEIPSAVVADTSRSEGNGVRGDRGSRRGRRRRPRSGGFPDTKYAQPSSVSAAPATGSAERLPSESLGVERSGVETAAAERPSFERAYADRSTLPRISGNERYGRDRGESDRSNRREEVGDESSPSEVIILPGESLAKYRRPGAEVGETAEKRGGSEEPSFISDALPPVTDEQALPSPETHQSQRAPSAAFEIPVQPEQFPAMHLSADKDEEPATAESSEEQSEIDEEADEIEISDRVFSHHEISEEELADIETERIDADTERLDSASAVAPLPITPIDQHKDLRNGGSDLPVHHQEFALPFESTGIVEITSPLIVQTEPLTTFGGSAPLGLSDEAEAEDEGEEVTSGEAQAGEPGQTATLRDQSGRSMHRVARRNRRRRGGNRSGSSGDSETAPALVTGFGAAPALQAAEPRRETFEPRTVERAERVMPSISDLLKAGQEIIVQIAKEPLGQKGARITSHIALPGRFVVFMPSVTHLGVSRKIASDEERQRLKQILQRHRSGTTGGFIVRTAGEGIPEDEIAADMAYLYNLWLDIRQKAEKKPAPALLHYDLDIVQRILRDHVTEDFKSIWVDNEAMYEGVLTFMQRFQPTLVSRVKMYTRSAPIFDAFNITQELEKALRPKVWLKSGGYIVINQTEALVAIDINTGKYVGKSNRLEDTIVKTNTEAVKEIVRQIRLRDLGGIIVVDFIDMDERKNRQKVMAALEEAMQSDKAPYKILQFNDFGLVAITRKRVKQSLERTLCSPCPYCEGAGYVKSVQTTIGEILIEAQKIAKAMDSKDAMLRVHPDVAKVLKASSNHFLEEMEETLGRPVLVTGDPTLHTEKFDLV